MTHRLVLVVLLLATTLAILPAPAAANWDQRDQYHLQSTGTQTFTNVAYAQTFTAGMTGELTRVRLQIFPLPQGEDPTPQLTLEIRTTANGIPTGSKVPGSGTVLASATLTSWSGTDLTEVVFDQRPALVAGSIYAIVAIPTNSWGWRVDLSGGYTGGQRISCDETCAASSVFDFDLVFETYVKQADSTAPTGSITRDSTDAYTNVRDVGLTLTCQDDISGCDQMQFSLYPADIQTPVPFSPAHTYTLPDAEGNYTISVRFLDRAGFWSQRYSATPITLDMTAPTGTVSLVNTTGYTNTRTTGLTLTCNDVLSSCSQMQFSTNGTDYSALETFATSSVVELPDADGPYTIHARFLDGAGNTSAAVSTTSIVLDRVAPTGTITLDNTTGYTNTRTIGLTLTCDDATSGCDDMQLSNVPGTTNAPIAFNPTHSHQLPATDGVYSVAVRFEDAAGNWSDTFTSSSITLDMTAPQVQADDLTLNPTSLAGAPANYQLTMSDNFTATGDLLVECVDQNNNLFPVGSTAPIGETTVTCTVTDLADNATTTSFTVTVRGVDGAFDVLKTQISALDAPAVLKRAMLAQVVIAERLADRHATPFSCLQLSVTDLTVRLMTGLRLLNTDDATAIRDQIRLVHEFLGCGGRR